MSGQLRLDSAELQATASALRLIAREFADASARSGDLKEALGHPELAGQVHHFAVGWDDRRAAMVESVTAMAEACSAIGEQFEEIDVELAAVLRGGQ